MMFSDLLIRAIQTAEIPLRFEPGAEEAVAQPVTELVRAWLLAHQPEDPATEFERGQVELVQQLLRELDDAAPVRD